MVVILFNASNQNLWVKQHFSLFWLCSKEAELIKWWLLGWSSDGSISHWDSKSSKEQNPERQRRLSEMLKMGSLFFPLFLPTGHMLEKAICITLCFREYFAITRISSQTFKIFFLKCCCSDRYILPYSQWFGEEGKHKSYGL